MGRDEDRVQASIEVDAESPKGREATAENGAPGSSQPHRADGRQRRRHPLPSVGADQRRGVGLDEALLHETITYQCDVQNDL